jgi:hypothetical protein
MHAARAATFLSSLLKVSHEHCKGIDQFAAREYGRWMAGALIRL